MFKIGLTGHVCAGKSTVAKMLSVYAGIGIIDTDRVARDVVRTNRAVLEKIKKAFRGVVLNDETLNRYKLGAVVLTNKDKRHELNEILLPEIKQEIVNRFNAYQRLGQRYVIYDAPLLFESDKMDYTIMVYVPHEVQIERVVSKHGFLRKEARAYVEAEPHIDQSMYQPHDFFLTNTLGFSGLRTAVAMAWDSIVHTEAIEN